MPHEREQLRARRLQAVAVRRDLTDSEIQEAASLVDELTRFGLPHVAAWAYDAIRRTYKRRRKTRSGYLSLRSIERSVLAKLVKGGLPITPSHAPSELTIGKQHRDEKGFERKVARLGRAVQGNIDRVREENPGRDPSS